MTAKYEDLHLLLLGAVCFVCLYVCVCGGGGGDKTSYQMIEEVNIVEAYLRFLISAFPGNVSLPCAAHRGLFFTPPPPPFFF